MALTPQTEQALLDAMLQHGNDPIELEMTVHQLCTMIGALQLALRHPTFPPRSRQILRQMIRQWRDALWNLDTNLARSVDLGFNKAYDR
jgi:hypothetical protein